MISISIDQWRASTGSFCGPVYGPFSFKLSRSSCDLEMVSIMVYFFMAFAFLLLLKHGDIEINAGPRTKGTRFFTCFCWNVNSILANNSCV